MAKSTSDDKRKRSDEDDEERGVGYATLGDLTAGDVPLQEADVEIREGVYVRVRAITRAELDGAGAGKGKGPLDIEVALIVTGLVEPKMTGPEVRRWAKTASAGEVGIVADAIAKLSKISQGGFEDAVRDF